jgi:POT family proton-dependent oligopeptide transporter
VASSILTGILQSSLGFHVGFGVVPLGMAIGLLQCSMGRKRLPDPARHAPDPLPRSRWPQFGAPAASVAVIVVLVLVGVMTATAVNAAVLAGITIMLGVALTLIAGPVLRMMSGVR